MDVTNVLAERGKRYGEFDHQAEYAQGIKRIFQSSPNWAEMKDDQREALDLIANKLGRILNGDPNYDDSWVDLAGYATLVANRLQRDQRRATDEEIERFNEKVDRYLSESLQAGGRLITGPYPLPPGLSGVV